MASWLFPVDASCSTELCRCPKVRATRSHCVDSGIEGTTLQGTFATVPSHDIGMNANDELEGSILMPSGGRGCLDPTQAFRTMRSVRRCPSSLVPVTVNEDCTVRGLVVFYPDVTCGPTPVPYPWCVATYNHANRYLKRDRTGRSTSSATTPAYKTSNVSIAGT